MAELTIEKIGGLAGFGLPNSRLRSRGSCTAEELTAADRGAVDALFAGKRARASPAGGDQFRYRITRQAAAGEQSVEVAEADVPAKLMASLKDEIV